jgi:hypothetical protein
MRRGPRGYRNLCYLLLKAQRIAATNTKFVVFRKQRESAIVSDSRAEPKKPLRQICPNVGTRPAQPGCLASSHSNPEHCKRHQPSDCRTGHSLPLIRAQTTRTRNSAGSEATTTHFCCASRTQTMHTQTKTPNSTGLPSSENSVNDKANATKPHPAKMAPKRASLRSSRLTGVTGLRMRLSLPYIFQCRRSVWLGSTRQI